VIEAKVLVSVAKEQVETIYKEIDTYSFNPLELQVRSLYTQNIYCKFQMEMKIKMAYRCDSLQDGTFRCSSVHGIIPKYGDRDYHVEANMDEGTYSCTCCKFERDGILCAHVLRVMDQIGVYEIPERYILRRWTWDSEEDLVEPDIEQPTVKKSMPEGGKASCGIHQCLRISSQQPRTHASQMMGPGWPKSTYMLSRKRWRH
jgi:hypothetical protein